MNNRRVLRVRSVETIAGPAVKSLIMRAIEAMQYPGTTPLAYYREIAADIASPKLGVFVGFAGDDPRAVAICYLPASQAAMGPQVAVAYSDDRALSRMIGERAREWIRSAGFDHLYALNLLHGDAAWFRVFAHVGECRSAGTLNEIRI